MDTNILDRNIWCDACSPYKMNFNENYIIAPLQR